MPSSSSSTFTTLGEIKAVLEGDLRPARKDKILPPLICDDLRHSDWTANGYVRYNEEERRKRLVTKCEELKESIHDPDGHFLRIDKSFSALFKCNLVITEPGTLTTIAKKAHQILMRLPSRPLSLLDFPINLSPAYFTAPSVNGHEGRRCHLSWEKLQVASFLGTNVIRMAVTQVLYPPGLVSSFGDYINCVADLLAICSSLESKTTNQVDQNSWFVVRAFLWSFWQRALMLYLYSNMATHLAMGFNHFANDDIFLKDTFPSPGLSTQEMSCRLSNRDKAKYMCSWAFELLRTDPICIGMDFRLFHERYSQLHGHHDARCNRDSREPCDGSHSDNCQRFRGMKILDQSAHDARCDGDCPKMSWDESSYRKITGARAVSLVDTEDGGELLRYCQTSDKTIAISHVWCHGQGGRPEEGINRCLHQKYKRIAEAMGCDSYWMDTVSIPEDHQLRDEAIRQINDVFASCHVTLVCDRDMMQIDTTDMNLKLMEAIIATMLVSDWNARAWTFLEAMRGRKHVQILCRDDQTVSFFKIVRAVFDQGRIDLVNLCLLVPHLLPWSTAFIPESDRRLPTNREKISLATAGAMLSYRPASRKGDDIVIWSLLFNDEPYYTAEAFWRSRIGTSIRTGFLISSAVRVRARGLGWAPATPYAAPYPQGPMSNTVLYRPFDGAGTERGRIEKDGLIAEWFVSEFPGQLLNTNLGIYSSKFLGPAARELDKSDEFEKIRARFLQYHRFGFLLHPILDSSSRHDLDRNPVAEYRGRNDGTLLVVCGSNQKKRYWKHDKIKCHWRGVYEWPRETPLPVFERRKILIT
jgi:hypothetical protein